MNWLAHLLLSEPAPAFRLGGILPDLVPASRLAAVPSQIQRGIQRHRRIDAFTDSHPVFRRSIRRLHPPFRRFGGILIDVLYDHFLSHDWRLYSHTPLSQFLADFYASIDRFRADLPPDAYGRLKQIQAAGWLSSYGELSGVAEAIRRIGLRLRRPFDLAPSISILRHNYDLLRADFDAFFPALRAYASAADIA